MERLIPFSLTYAEGRQKIQNKTIRDPTLQITTFQARKSPFLE